MFSSSDARSILEASWVEREKSNLLDVESMILEEFTRPPFLFKNPQGKVSIIRHMNHIR